MSEIEAPVIPGPAPVIPRAEKYLRNRPFLLITLIRRPTSGVRTEKAGWTENPNNWNTFERPVIVDRVNATHLRNANIIIDITQAKTVKNSFVETAEDQVVNYYLTKYEKECTEAMDIWLTNVAQNLTAEALRAGANGKSAVTDGEFSLA